MEVQEPAGNGARLSLVIPAYQESAGIEHVIEESEKSLIKLGLCDFEIIIVDDGSTDDTFEIANRTAQKHNHTRVLKLEKNCGYGRALRTGFEAARFEKVAFTDADNQFFLEDLEPLLKASNNADIAAGYRFDRQDPKLRIFLSRGYNLLVHTLMQTQVRDCDCALKVYNRSALMRILPESNNFFVNTEMFHRAAQAGLSIQEVPVRHRTRHAGTSKVGFLEVPKTLKTLIPYWWSQHFFRNESNANKSPGGSLGYFAGMLLLLIFSMFLFGSRMRTPLLEPQEARYAEVPREMLLSDEWVVPLLHGKPYLDKPPLAYWAVMVAYDFMGIRDESARMIPLICGVLGVFALAFWGWASNAPWQGLIAGFVLCLSNRFLYLGRMLAPDCLLCLWVTLGLCFGYLACQGQRFRPGYWLLCSLCAGLGLLTKGPVSLVLIFMPLFFWSLVEPRLKRPKLKAWLWGPMVSLGLFLPWFIAIMRQQPDFFEYFFLSQNVQRFMAPIDHEEPIWFFLPQLFLGTMPWCLLLPSMLLSGMKPGSKQKTGMLGGFAMLAGTFALVFLSLGGCKRAIYLLPVLPPLAMALGCWIWESIQTSNLKTSSMAIFQGSSRAIFNGMGAMILGAIGVLAAALTRGLIKPGVAMTGCTALLTLLGCWVLLKALLPTQKASFGMAFAMMFLLLLGGIREILPAYNNAFSLRGHLREYLKAEKKLPELVVCYPHAWDSVPFYLPSSRVVSFSADQRGELFKFLEKNTESLVLVKTGRFARELMGELPGSLEFKPNSHPGSVTIGWVRRKDREPQLSQFSQ